MSTWAVVGEAWMRLRLVCFPSLSSDILSTASTNPSKKPTLSMMRWDERWKLLSRLLKRLWQKKRRKHKDTLLIRAVRCAHTGLICFVTARVYLFFRFAVRKRRSKVSSPFKQHWRLGGFFFQGEWAENLDFKVLSFCCCFFFFCPPQPWETWGKMIFDGHESVRSWPNPFVIFLLIVEADPAIKSKKEQPVWKEKDIIFFSATRSEPLSPKNGMIFQIW